MTHDRRFRFGVQGRGTGPADAWLASVRRVEDAGFSTYVVLDHFVRGMDPIVALGAAAAITSTLRLGSMLIDNDFRHPVVLAKSMATIDVLSRGRLELGLGAGWLKEEYDQAGIPFERAGQRIERMVEAIHLLIGAFQDEPLTFEGRHYSTCGLRLVPKPVQKPHPPIVIGGGSKRILGIAGREADIVSLTTRARADGTKDTADMTPAAALKKVEWVRATAGARFDELELAAMVSHVVVTDNRASAASALAAELAVDTEDVLASPFLLVGTIDQMIDGLKRRREQLGLSYLVVIEGNMEKLVPVVERLSGT